MTNAMGLLGGGFDFSAANEEDSLRLRCRRYVTMLHH